MIREYLREIGLHIHSQGLGWYPRKRADAYEIRLCLHVVLVRIPRAGAVQLWTTIFKHLIQLSAAPVNSTDPCTYEKKFVNSLEVLIRSSRYEKMQFQDELNSPWNAISKAVIVFLFLPFFPFSFSQVSMAALVFVDDVATAAQLFSHIGDLLSKGSVLPFQECRSNWNLVLLEPAGVARTFCCFVVLVAPVPVPVVL